ncbi:uncharacterized protein B0I36DRAFT_322304 [Microdochium trichocladiopsis]|uniref:Uncharacterized protein n=1 Tax=Microdochium trichocladiopsis TaxID=1682393 RepID=A0A9P8Y677_9PEZI|nr:uncharacterized protein B0I36DRAFT_322304 [Microdochium trichocladiopsis]KAH7030717.1 hypothetical protein B0I36DRAFT_322304 [Microdochium trichocladiopsis]
MPTYTYTGPHSGVTTTQIEAGGHGRSGDIEDARTRRHHDRHGKTRATRKHSGKTRSGANNKHGKSKRRHQQSSRHHDVSGSAANGATTTESSLSSSTNSSGESNEKRGRDREHRRRARSPPRPFMGCFPPVRSRRMRARIVQCVVAGLFLVLIVGICKSSSCSTFFAGLALTNTVDPSQLTIPMAVIVGISALILIYLIARLVMLIKHKRNKAKLRAQRRNDLEAQHQKQQQQQSAYAPHIALPSDREVPGLDAGIARVEPPAYGHWRESMRASPNRAYWQHSEPSPISEKSQRSPQEADYANHPAVIGSSSAPPANAEPASYLTMRHDNEVVYDNSAVSDLGSSALSSFSPSPSAVSSPSVVHATRAFVHQDALPTTVPTTPWPRPPSYISDNGNTPRARNNNHANTNTNNTTTSPSSFLAPPNPPPTLMQLPSDFSLFDPSASRVHDQTQHLYHHQQQQEEDDDDDNAQDILPATKFQPAYYIPDPRDTQAYQARQQQDYSIDRAASEAAMSRAQSPVHQHHQHQYHQYGTAASSALGVGARSDCGTIEVGITQSQYFGGGAGVGYGGLGSYCGSRVGGVDERDEIVYDDFHHNQGVGEEEEVAYLDVEVYSDDEVVHGGKEGGLDAEEEEENSKRKSRSNRDRRRKERRGQGKVDGTPLIGQLGGVNGWS